MSDTSVCDECGMTIAYGHQDDCTKGLILNNQTLQDRILPLQRRISEVDEQLMVAYDTIHQLTVALAKCDPWRNSITKNGNLRGVCTLCGCLSGTEHTQDCLWMKANGVSK